MKKLGSLWRRITDKWWKRIVVTPVILIAALLGIWGAAEGLYQLKVARLSAAVNEIGGAYVEPNGGIAKPVYIKAPHFSDSLLCIDNGPCPMVTKRWLVLVDPKQEKGYIHEALQEAGYQGIADFTPAPEANGGGVKSDISMSVGFYPVHDEQVPYVAPVGKEWKWFDASAD